MTIKDYVDIQYAISATYNEKRSEELLTILSETIPESDLKPCSFFHESNEILSDFERVRIKEDRLARSKE